MFQKKIINVMNAIFQDKNFNITLVNSFVKFFTTGPTLVLKFEYTVFRNPLFDMPRIAG